LEVETPMMQPIPGGAAARPFITHHNALDMQLYLRIAPELYLKRLVVGGFEKVYEINRNFRNEGLSTRHNPEFTMLEFYQAYADYRDLMDLTEALLRGMAQTLLGHTVQYQGESYDFGQPFQRLTVREAILRFNPEIDRRQLDDLAAAGASPKVWGLKVQAEHGLGRVQLEIFEQTVEHQLRDPTFITAYPTEVSPLARRNDADPSITDRFELFVGGREIANGFSELNDPRIRRNGSASRSKPRRPAMQKPCTTTPITSGRWNTACRRRRGRASASTGWSCCSPMRLRSAMCSCSRTCGRNDPVQTPCAQAFASSRRTRGSGELATALRIGTMLPCSAQWA
jgi:lysyl-tRNA synthetase